MKAHPQITFSLMNILKSSSKELEELKPSEKLIVAVSGGIDSIVLLNLLSRLYEKEKLIVAHFDHKLRNGSDLDAEFVKKVGADLGLKVEVGVATDQPGKDNLEAWARDRRYGFLESVRKSVGARWILTAHNQNDQVETILMRLINGRIATKSFGIAAVDNERSLLRPLLKVSRSEIKECADELNLEFQEDPTNLDLSRTRNKFRHQLIPLLIAEYNPRLLDSLSEVSTRLSADEAELWGEAKKAQSNTTGPSVKWSAEEFVQLPFALQWRVLDGYVELSGSEQLNLHREIGFRALRLATERINQNPKDTFTLDLGACIRMKYSHRGGPKFEFYQHRLPS
jgi:tRNA(Ile)-lysidine synthetase-like protein